MRDCRTEGHGMADGIDALEKGSSKYLLWLIIGGCAAISECVRITHPAWLNFRLAAQGNERFSS